MKKTQKETVLILHNIRSNHNVGAIFRTADCAGISKIYLTGYTPTPLDKFGREVGEIKKTALGAEKTIVWEKEKNIGKILKKLKAEDFQIIAIEQDKNSIDYKTVSASGGKLAFILGNEVKGLYKKILDKCDLVAEIPMRGKFVRNRQKDQNGKESLNVSVSAGVALFRILNI